MILHDYIPEDTRTQDYKAHDLICALTVVVHEGIIVPKLRNGMRLGGITFEYYFPNGVHIEIGIPFKLEDFKKSYPMLGVSLEVDADYIKDMVKSGYNKARSYLQKLED